MIVTDVAGVKGPIVAELDHPRFIAGHPMAGSEQEGPDGADPELFVGATWVLTPTATLIPAPSPMQSVIAALGADVVALAADRHDELVAVVSHVPHLTSATLMSLAGESSLDHAALMRLAAGGFRDMTRIAAGSPAIWPDICRDNAGAIVPVLDRLVERLGEVRRIVADGDRASARLPPRLRPRLPPKPPTAGLAPSSRGGAARRGPGPPRRSGRGDHAGRGAGREHLRHRDRALRRRAPRCARARHRRLRRRSGRLAPARAGLPAVVDEGGCVKRPPHRGDGDVIAIDGPAGSGKSTVATALAERLDLQQLDTGAMYRAVTLLALRAGIDLGDAGACAALARGMSLEMGAEIRLDGEDVSAAIRTPEVDAAVSIVAAHPAVRAELVKLQRSWIEVHGGGVVEGRDIGSVVAPDAGMKVYLTADPDERARRRAAQHAGSAAVVGAGAARLTEAAIARRDGLDTARAVSPLVVADGAIVVDTTGRSVADVVEEVLSYL